MSQPRGRRLSLSPFRRLVVDLMHFSRKAPCVAVERRMNLARLVDARQACSPRPSWTALFIKAFAIVARGTPALRQTYMSFPWAHLYEHGKNIAVINVERQWGDEKVVVLARIRSPENRPLEQLDALLRDYKDTPLEQIPSFRRDMSTARLPWPLRRMLWWGALNLFGRRRCHNFGTFAVTSVAAHGAGVLHVIPLLTSQLHYGLLDEDGRLDMRMTFDHRVLDGVTAAGVLVGMENALLNELLEEVQGLRVARRAA